MSRTVPSRLLVAGLVMAALHAWAVPTAAIVQVLFDELVARDE